MAKFLITSIGGRKPDPSTQQQRPMYQNTAYYIANEETTIGETYEAQYIIDAIQHFYQYDKVILLGTVASGWVDFYWNIMRTTSEATDEQMLQCVEDIERFQINANHATDPDDMYRLLQPLKDAMGERCAEIIILRYGLNAKELNENFKRLQRVNDFVQNGDSLCFDITHSFRSLPLYELIAVDYIKQVAQKNVQIEEVTYGMFDASREFENKTPIVNLAPITDIMTYTKAVEEYRRFGTTFALCDALQFAQEGSMSSEQRDALMGLNSTVTNNDFAACKQMIATCIAIAVPLRETTFVSPLNLFANQIVEEIAQDFEDCTNGEDDIITRIALSDWHSRKNRCIIASVTIVETLISFFTLACGESSDNDEAREHIRKQLYHICRHRNAIVGDLLSHYHALRTTRNAFAHPTAHGSPFQQVDALKRRIHHVRSVYNAQFRDKTLPHVQENFAALRVALGAE